MYMWVSTVGSTHHKYYGPPFKNLLSPGAYLAPSLSEHSTDTFGYFAVLWSSEQGHTQGLLVLLRTGTCLAGN